ncbi:hypothetical protein JNN96_29215 [Mycobacterium sp. DSM 3803]|nr:hypothetical protein [Mycobacterium sp. DSM 3803]
MHGELLCGPVRTYQRLTFHSLFQLGYPVLGAASLLQDLDKVGFFIEPERGVYALPERLTGVP